MLLQEIGAVVRSSVISCARKCRGFVDVVHGAAPRNKIEHGYFLSANWLVVGVTGSEPISPTTYVFALITYYRR